MTPADGAAPGAPESIGRYRIVERLTSGAGGDVYKGFDPLLQRPLAIKMLRVTIGDRAPEAVDRIKERFYREIQRVAALVHPAIARLFDGGEVPGGFFVASEFVDGTGLDAMIAEGRPPDVRAKVALLRQIAEALDYAREHDTPHLNLKTSNVFVCADRSLKVGGFGTARVLEAIAASAPGAGSAAAEWVTRFTAPEMAAGGAGDARADVYSFAAVAVELLGGTPIGGRDRRPATWMEGGSLPSLPAVAGDAGAAAAAAVLARALSRDVDRRYASAGACFEALGAALGLARAASSKSWETPQAAAGVTADQLNQLEDAATQPGVPTFTRTPPQDLEETYAGPMPPVKAVPAPSTPEATRVKARTAPAPAVNAPPAPRDEPTSPRLETPHVPPSGAVAETILVPRAQPEAAGPTGEAPPADPSEVKTILMPAAPKAVRFDRAPAAPAADADAGKTTLIPRKKTEVPDPDAGKTIFRPRKSDAPVAADPSEAKTALMPPVPKAPSPPVPIPDPLEIKTTLKPSVPKAARFDPAVPAPAAAGKAGSDEPGRTVMLSASDARGVVPAGTADKTVLIPAARRPTPAAPATDAADRESTARRAAVPPPAPATPSVSSAAAPGPPAGAKPLAFPPPPPAQPPAAKTLAPRAGGAQKSAIVTLIVLLLLVVIVLVAAGAAAFWYVPALRQLWTQASGGSRSSAPPLSQPPPAAEPPPPPPATAAAPAPVPALAETTPEPPSSVAPDAPAAPGAAPPVVPAGGSLRITSTPPGASVLVDGRRRGVTPLRLAGVSFGNHVIEVTLDGYKAERQSVSLSAQRAARNIDVRLTRAVVAPTTGAVSVVTEPPGARVLVDGSAAGNSPLTVANLAPGKHAVQAEREGFETAMREVEIKAGDTLSLNIRLAAVASRPAAPPVPVGPVPFEAVEVKPRLTRGPDSPPYPRAAAQARLAGVVQIAWIVDENGSVSDVQVLESSSGLFESEVVGWARGLRYEPGRQAGKPVKVRIVRRFSFQTGR